MEGHAPERRPGKAALCGGELSPGLCRAPGLARSSAAPCLCAAKKVWTGAARLLYKCFYGSPSTFRLSCTTGPHFQYDTRSHWSAPVATDPVLRLSLIVDRGLKKHGSLRTDLHRAQTYTDRLTNTHDHPSHPPTHTRTEIKVHTHSQPRTHHTVLPWQIYLYSGFYCNRCVCTEGFSLTGYVCVEGLTLTVYSYRRYYRALKPIY